jgi:flagellar biosynthesis repressor protein FlbT
MKGRIQITLKPGERIYINGAVLRVDRKVMIEMLNDVTFLLENHVMQPDAANTPLRQLYFIVQTMLMDPANAATTKDLFNTSHALLSTHFSSPEIATGLDQAHSLVEQDKVFDALKAIRTLLPLEEAVLTNLKRAQRKHNQEKREVA